MDAEERQRDKKSHREDHPEMERKKKRKSTSKERNSAAGRRKKKAKGAEQRNKTALCSLYSVAGAGGLTGRRQSEDGAPCASPAQKGLPDRHFENQPSSNPRPHSPALPLSPTRYLPLSRIHHPSTHRLGRDESTRRRPDSPFDRTPLPGGDGNAAFMGQGCRGSTACSRSRGRGRGLGGVGGELVGWPLGAGAVGVPPPGGVGGGV